MRVEIPYDKYEKIMYFVNKSTVEISMMARVTHEDDLFTVQNVYLLEQENTASTTDIDAEAMSTLMYSSREDEGHLNCWIHSHVNMPVFWSGTDHATIKEVGDKGFVLAIVFNKKKEMRAAYYQGNNGFLPAAFMDELPIEITYPVSASVEDWAKEYKEKCKTKSWNVNHYKGKPTKSGGKVWNHVVGDWVYTDGLDDDDYMSALYRNSYQDPDVPKLPKTEVGSDMVEDGTINPKAPIMRWGEKENKWLQYKQFCKTRIWYDSDNYLDDKNLRQKAMAEYKKCNGAYPLTDYVLNDWYMEENDINIHEFYTYGEVQ